MHGAPRRGDCNATYWRRGGAEPRMTTCRLPAVVAAGASNGGGLQILWSRDLVASQTEYVGTDPFPVKKFMPYLPQLPQTSSIPSARPSLCKLGPDHRCSSCAVIGASGTLLSHRHGSLIDEHEVVIRPNMLKLKGYEDHVGQRTSLNVMFALENMVDQFMKSQRLLPSADRAVGLATPSKRSISSYFRYMGRMKTGAKHPWQQHQAGDAPLLLLSDQVWLAAMSTLCANTGGGCVWPTRSATMRPSTGLYSVLIALNSCDKVSSPRFPVPIAPYFPR